MVDKNYAVSLLGCANLIEMALLIGSFIGVTIASSSYAQIFNLSSQLSQSNQTDVKQISPHLLYDIDIETIRQIAQAILILIFLLTLISFFTHILFAFRYRYSWHRLSTGIGFFCIIYAFALFAISVAVSCWEDKVRKRLTDPRSNDQVLSLLNPSSQPKIGSAAAAATFGFAGCFIFLIEALIRFRRLADKIHI